MTGNGSPNSSQQTPKPNPALKRLDKLVGTWDIKGRESGSYGEITGRLTFDWLDGGFFLVQHTDINYVGRKIKGIEIIGYEWEYGADAPGQDCTSHYFDNMGHSWKYIYDVGDDTMTIWGGERGSPAAFRGKFSDDRNTITGRWEWPGGGYKATMTRVK